MVEQTSEQQSSLPLHPPPLVPVLPHVPVHTDGEGRDSKDGENDKRIDAGAESEVIPPPPVVVLGDAGEPIGNGDAVDVAGGADQNGSQVGLGEASPRVASGAAGAGQDAASGVPITKETPGIIPNETKLSKKSLPQTNEDTKSDSQADQKTEESNPNSNLAGGEVPNARKDLGIPAEDKKSGEGENGTPSQGEASKTPSGQEEGSGLVAKIPEVVVESTQESKIPPQPPVAEKEPEVIATGSDSQETGVKVDKEPPKDVVQETKQEGAIPEAKPITAEQVSEPNKEEPKEEKKEEKKEEEKKDWRSKLPGSIDELKGQGVGGLLNKGKGFLGL